jgi:hypothetical protein
MYLKVIWKNIYLCGRYSRYTECENMLQNSVQLKFTWKRIYNEREEENEISGLLDQQKM